MRTEDDILQAFRELARSAPEAEAILADLPARPRAGRRGHRWRRIRLFTPAAAAAAVLAVIALALDLSPAGHPQRSAPAPVAGAENAPRYYVDLLLPNLAAPVSNPTTSAVIDNAVTGGAIATVLPPRPYATFVATSGAANGTTFVLAAQPRRTRGRKSYPTKFFRAQLDPARHAVTLSPLPFRPYAVPNSAWMGGMALSPDGSSLAVAVVNPGHGVQLRVYSLLTGTIRTWTGSGSIGAPIPSAAMSWGPNGLLAINYNTHARAGSGMWLLHTTASNGGALISDSRLLRSFPVTDVSGLLSPDGTTLTVAVLKGDLTAYPSLEQFSAVTGREIRALPQGTFDPVWSNWSGSVLVMQSTHSGGFDEFGILRGNDFVPIKGALNHNAIVDFAF